MNKTKAGQFLLLFYYWLGRLGFRDTVRTLKDNRLNVPLCIDDWHTKDPVLKYNAKKIAYWKRPLMLCGLFHEVGHLLHNMPYKTEKQQIEAEYRAEVFALSLLKLHYPEEYKENIELVKEMLQDRDWQEDKSITIYKLAYQKIPEYRIKKMKGK